MPSIEEHKRPILITGAHRSGTTWVGQTIAQHPRVRYVAEPFNVDQPNPMLELKLNAWFTHYPSSNQKHDIQNAFDNLLKFQPLTHAIKTCRAAGLDIKTPLRFGRHFWSEFLLRPRILVKDPIALLSAGWLYETYNFKAVVMVRNPLAFVGSLKKAGWDFDFKEFQKQDGLMQGWLNRFSDQVDYMCGHMDETDIVDRAALLWNMLHFVILEYQKKFTDWLFIKHEDIAVNPEKYFTKIFDYLGLNINQRVLAYIRKYTSQTNPADASSAAYQPRNSEQTLHTWKQRLSEEEVERVKGTTSELAMQLYGDGY
jgi:hypothetical protein